MAKTIGIRREDKNQWERRTPLIPEAIKELKTNFGIETIIQPSNIRVFDDEEYLKAGAEVNEDLSRADIIFGVKEMPESFFEQDKTYVFFSHTIKGQTYNLEMLKRMMDLKVNLIDYERIVNDKGQRLIFFGKHAGLAGMIETLFAFGQKTKKQGLDTPLENIQQAYHYPTLDQAKKEIAAIGKEISSSGLPQSLCPLVVGFAGYGNVSRGAQEIFDLLPHQVISPAELQGLHQGNKVNNKIMYKVEFKEEDMVRAKIGQFELQDYYHNPDKYESKFETYLPHLNMLVNCIYWTEDYPRLVTKDYFKKVVEGNTKSRLSVVGDISCDIDGSIEITYKSTMPDEPVFTYFPENDSFEDGIKEGGISVMAVDNLPCEFPKDSSVSFSEVLKDFVKDLVSVNFAEETDKLQLAEPLKIALILHQGQLTNEYKYMNDFLKGVS